MAIPGLGDAIMLFDVSVRVTTFINDLRHAQDDFISLRSEADCLRICLGSLTSDSCQNALYHYITIKQGQDLKQIIDNTRLNMVDLSVFIAKCAKLGDNSSITVRRKRDFFKKIGKAIGKGFTAYKFVMTNQQAFRDKLVLPTASINVFLTSMTHVGLVNMGRIMVRTGHGMAVPTASGGGKKQNTKPNVIVDPMEDWQAMGRRIAFRDTLVRQSDLSASFEDDILEYALHLIRGGIPFYAKAGGGGTKHKVTKTTKTKVGSRSRSRGPLSLGKDRGGQKYIMRKQSVSSPSTEKIEIVQQEWESGSESNEPGRRLLALPAPDNSSSSRQYVEIKPDSAPSSDEDPVHSEVGSNRSHGHRQFAGSNSRRRSSSTRDTPAHAARGPPSTSPEEIKSRRRHVQAMIREEQEEAYRELEREEEASRTRRRQSRPSRPTFHDRGAEAEYDRELEDYERELERHDVLRFLEEQYGVIAEPLAVRREPIDNGIVKDIPPPTASGVGESVSDSEQSDSPPTPPRSRSKTASKRSTNDTLRAQTYTGPIRHRPFIPRTTHFEPYSDPHGPEPYRPEARPQSTYHRERPYPHHEYADDSRFIVLDERQSPLRKHPRATRPYPYRRNSDDFSDGDHYELKRPPRGPPPGPTPNSGAEKGLYTAAGLEEDKLKSRPSTRPREDEIPHRRGYYEEHGPGWRGSEPSRAYIRPVRLRRASSPALSIHDEFYMRGARSDRDDESDGSDPGAHIELVRK
jgi:hypothetical protein